MTGIKSCVKPLVRLGRSQRGMTLVEVVLALGLFVMLGLFIIGVVRSVLGIWQTSERPGRGDLEFMAALECIQSDVAALHTGPQGWLSLDSWQVRAPGENEEPWMAPRLRFLARGSGLRSANPDGRGAVEVMWTVVPEAGAGQRLGRLVRFVQPAESPESISSDRYAASMAKGLAAMSVLDGIGNCEFVATERDGAVAEFVDIAPDTLFDFPRAISFSLNRVEGLARTKPPLLDNDIGTSSNVFELRGSVPLGVGDTVLLEREFIELRGTFPKMTVGTRGVYGTAPHAHARGTGVLFFRPYQGQVNLPSQGRRLQP